MRAASSPRVAQVLVADDVAERVPGLGDPPREDPPRVARVRDARPDPASPAAAPSGAACRTGSAARPCCAPPSSRPTRRGRARSGRTAPPCAAGTAPGPAARPRDRHQVLGAGQDEHVGRLADPASAPSRYRGTPCDVLRVTPGRLSRPAQPERSVAVTGAVPQGQLRLHPTPARPARAIGTEKLPVPVNRSGENFSPIPL